MINRNKDFMIIDDKMNGFINIINISNKEETLIPFFVVFDCDESKLIKLEEFCKSYKGKDIYLYNFVESELYMLISKKVLTIPKKKNLNIYTPQYLFDRLKIGTNDLNVLSSRTRRKLLINYYYPEDKFLVKLDYNKVLFDTIIEMNLPMSNINIVNKTLELFTDNYENAKIIKDRLIKKMGLITNITNIKFKLVK